MPGADHKKEDIVFEIEKHHHIHHLDQKEFVKDQDNEITCVVSSTNAFLENPLEQNTVIYQSKESALESYHFSSFQTITEDDGNIALGNTEEYQSSCIKSFDSFQFFMQENGESSCVKVQEATSQAENNPEHAYIPSLLLVRPDMMIPLETDGVKDATMQTKPIQNSHDQKEQVHSVAYRSVAQPTSIGVAELELQIKSQKARQEEQISQSSAPQTFPRSESTPNILRPQVSGMKRKHQRALKSADYQMRDVYAAGASREGYIVDAKFQATSPKGSRHELTDLAATETEIPSKDTKEPMSVSAIVEEENDSTAENVASAISHLSQIREPVFATQLDSKYSLDRGIQIDEKHANFVLMYDMLTGIRIAVSKRTSQPAKEISSADFRYTEKLPFDIQGRALTPSSKYDFKFKDYAPHVFLQLRNFFRVDQADYLLSLTGRYALSELNSPGKSGSFFYFSQDYRFIIKTISHTEHKFLRRILSRYYHHVSKNPHTLLSRFYGLHRVKLPRGKKIPFVVMGNIFPPNKDIHEIYDLKGSKFGREVSEEKIIHKPNVVRKDLNFVARKKKLILGFHKRQLLMEQIERDCKFLEEAHIMDYSLLLGIHDRTRGNTDNIRNKMLSVMEAVPDASATVKSRFSAKKGLQRQADKLSFTPSDSKFPEANPEERRHCVFYQDEGGYLSTDQDNQPAEELYYIGIIDILTPYNFVKKVENRWKSIRRDEMEISAVSPRKYARRFISFMKQYVVDWSSEDEAVKEDVPNSLDESKD